MLKEISTTKNLKGFTLVEILLYVSLVSMILITIVSFFSVIVQIQARNQTVSEVDQSGAQILELITQTIRTSTNVNSPAVGASAAAISLNVPVGASTPTVFDLSAGKIRIKEGAGAVVNLNSNRTTASNLSFQNVTGTSPKRTIKFQFTLTYNNPDNKQQFNYAQVFYGSATLR